MRETVAVLKAADMAPLDVTGYGTVAERGEVSEDERVLMAQRGGGEFGGGGGGHAESSGRRRARSHRPRVPRQ